MTAIKHRNMRFAFDDDTPFYWNPENPGFSRASNGASFLIVAFEKYLVRTLNAAIPLLKDAGALEEAEALILQEGRHSMAHLRHTRALCKQYPDLNAVLPALEAYWDELYDSRTLKSNLAIVANIELMFTPVAKAMIRDVDALFAGGDRKVASMFLWHSMEEMEHRCSAITVYDALFPRSSLYRLFQWPHIARQLNGSRAMLSDYFTSVPDYEAISADVVREIRSKTSRSRLDEFQKVYSVLKSQLPFYNAEHEVLPEFALDWHRRQEAGEDMTMYFGADLQA